MDFQGWVILRGVLECPRIAVAAHVTAANFESSSTQIPNPALHAAYRVSWPSFQKKVSERVTVFLDQRLYRRFYECQNIYATGRGNTTLPPLSSIACMHACGGVSAVPPDRASCHDTRARVEAGLDSMDSTPVSFKTTTRYRCGMRWALLLQL